MILICPSCQTRYFTSEAALGPSGRSVRCAACDHSWFAKPPETLDADAPVQDESGLTRAQVERLRQKAQENVRARTGPHTEMRERSRLRNKRNRMIAAGLAWSACGVLLVSGAAASITFREQVVQVWPKTASFYASLGLDVNRFGLEFGALDARRSFDGTTPVLTISGRAKNVTEHHRASPIVRIGLRNEDGEEVHVERVGLMSDVISPGAETSFIAHLVSPPMDSFDLEVSFEAGTKDAGSDKAGSDSNDHGESHDTDMSHEAGHEDTHGAPSDHAPAHEEEHGDTGHDDADTHH